MKRYRLQAIICASLMVLGMTGCGQQDAGGGSEDNAGAVTEQTTEATSEIVQSEAAQEAVVETQAAEAAGSLSEEDFVVDIKGVAVKLGDDMSTLEESLGEPDSYETAKSCMGAGEDKVYEYGGITVYTYPIDGVDVVSAIEFVGEETMASGIGVGSTRDEVVAAFGSDCEEDEYGMTYELGDKTLGIELDGDSVSFIEIYGE
ncbi:MAG: hypothetical protein IJ326_05500 [Lachnospiraceae bacterium]|nr:hypothetical protein [Lachnospiraceae bacterium]